MKLRALFAVVIVALVAPGPAAARAGSLDRRFGVDGRSPRTTVGSSADAWGVAAGPDGSVLAFGQAYGGRAGDAGRGLLAKFTRDGMLDPRFGARGQVLLPSNFYAVTAAVFTDGSVIAVGHHSVRHGMMHSTETPMAVRVTARGTMDRAFGTNGVVDLSREDDVWVVGRVAALPDGKALLALPRVNNEPRLLRLNRDGSTDPTYGVAGSTPPMIHPFTSYSFASMHVAQDGSAILAGGFDNIQDATEGLFIARVRADGLTDPTFGRAGHALLPMSDHDEVVAVRTLPSGHIQTVGFVGTSMVTTRHTADGTLDTTFAGDGVAGARVTKTPNVAIDRAGRVVVHSAPEDWLMRGTLLTRYSAGRADRAFGTVGVERWLIGNMHLTDTSRGPVLIGQPPSGPPTIAAIRLLP